MNVYTLSEEVQKMQASIEKLKDLLYECQLKNENLEKRVTENESRLNEKCEKQTCKQISKSIKRLDKKFKKEFKMLSSYVGERNSYFGFDFHNYLKNLISIFFHPKCLDHLNATKCEESECVQLASLQQTSTNCACQIQDIKYLNETKCPLETCNKISNDLTSIFDTIENVTEKLEQKCDDVTCKATEAKVVFLETNTGCPAMLYTLCLILIE